MTASYSHRAVWRIAAPMVASSITVPLLGMVDTAVMGHLDASWYLGAVAAGATIFSMLFMGLNFLRMGTTGITAQAFGAGDTDRLREALGQPVIVALVLAGAMITLRGPIIDLALTLIAPGPEVDRFTREYFAIRVFSAPASLCNFVLIGWLLGMQNARGPLAMMLSINLANIAMDLLFVLGFGMKVEGVAIATLLAELLGLGIGLVFVNHELSKHPGRWATFAPLQLVRYKRLFDVNLNLFLRTMALMFVFAFITARGARISDLILATNAVLMNFQLFLSYALDGVAHAAEALVGKATGARDRDGLKTAVRVTLHWSLLFAAVFSAVYALTGTQIIDLLTGLEPVRDAARDYLPWLVALPLISVWSFLYDGVYVGATLSKQMMIVMVGSTVCVFLPCWLVFDQYGNHGLWLAFTLFMAARGIGMHAWFRRLMRHSGTGALYS